MNENLLNNSFPQMALEELEACVPLDVAFEKLRAKARKYYVAKS